LSLCQYFVISAVFRVCMVAVSCPACRLKEK
jgi:hypothetical protein